MTERNWLLGVSANVAVSRCGTVVSKHLSFDSTAAADIDGSLGICTTHLLLVCKGKNVFTSSACIVQNVIRYDPSLVCMHRTCLRP
jgi:hypothetical protein